MERIKAALELRTPANQIAACLREANVAMGIVNEDDLPKPQVAERLLRALSSNCPAPQLTSLYVYPKDTRPAARLSSCARSTWSSAR